MSSTWKMAGIAALAAIGIGIAVPVISVVTQPARSVAGVVGKTFDSGNMIATYERFHDRWKGYESRLQQIAETRKNLDAESDSAEKIRLRVELSAQRQSCREIAAGYNADATKTNRAIFQGREAPLTLSMEAC